MKDVGKVITDVAILNSILKSAEWPTHNEDFDELFFAKEIENNNFINFNNDNDNNNNDDVNYNTKQTKIEEKMAIHKWVLMPYISSLLMQTQQNQENELTSASTVSNV